MNIDIDRLRRLAGRCNDGDTPWWPDMEDLRDVEYVREVSPTLLLELLDRLEKLQEIVATKKF